MATNAAADDDDDPILATYSVFVKPPLPAHRKLMVLQHPNTHSEDPAMLQSPPITEIRLKPGSGMIEADVPIDYDRQYDRLKGMGWGAALQKSLAAKGGGSLGLAGGFGVGAAAARTAGARRGAGADDDDVEGGDWAEAVRVDRVLRTQTLGGLSAPALDARYMVGVFQGKNIHLTPVSSLVHLRPQMHYLDAATEQERLGRAGGGSGASGGAGGKEGGAGAGGSGGAARAIHMTIKSTAADGDEVVTETMADRLRAVQLEGWRRMEYADEDTEDAWNAYQESLFLRPAGAGPPPPAAAPDPVDADDDDEEEGGEEDDDKVRDKGKGKGKEKEVAVAPAPADVGGAADLDERVPRLETDWGEDELLRAVSGIKATDKKPGEEAVTEPGEPMGGGGREKGKGKEVVTPTAAAAADARKRVARAPRNPATAAGAPRRGGRAKAAPRGGAGNAMEID